MTNEAETTETITVTMYGGYSYAIGEPETFASLLDACQTWTDRHDSNGLRRVDGVFWPTWGDMAEDDYAISTEHEGWTRAQVIAMANGTAYVDPDTMESIVKGYVSALTWVGLYAEDENGETVSVDAAPDEYGMDDLAPDLLDEIRSEVADFVSSLTAEDGAAYFATQDGEQMGHDFYLTRNGHGAGFWDRGLGELGDRLSEAAKVYGEHVAYLDENGTVQS